MPFHEARTHEQNVAGAECGALCGGNGFEVGGVDGVAGYRGVCDVVGLSIREVVEENAAADDATVLGPFWRLY